jgi:hypothetical protein
VNDIGLDIERFPICDERTTEMFVDLRLHKILAILFVCSISQAMAGTVDRADLAAPDEIVRVRALWGIAQAGKASGCTEADVLPLLTKTWEGRRLSKWCLHALVNVDG